MSAHVYSRILLMRARIQACDEPLLKKLNEQKVVQCVCVRAWTRHVCIRAWKRHVCIHAWARHVCMRAWICTAERRVGPIFGYQHMYMYIYIYVPLQQYVQTLDVCSHRQEALNQQASTTLYTLAHTYTHCIHTQALDVFASKHESKAYLAFASSCQ